MPNPLPPTTTTTKGERIMTDCTRCSDRTALIDGGYCRKCLIKTNSPSRFFDVIDAQAKRIEELEKALEVANGDVFGFQALLKSKEKELKEVQELCRKRAYVDKLSNDILKLSEKFSSVGLSLNHQAKELLNKKGNEEWVSF